MADSLLSDAMRRRYEEYQAKLARLRATVSVSRATFGALYEQCMKLAMISPSACVPASLPEPWASDGRGVNIPRWKLRSVHCASSAVEAAEAELRHAERSSELDTFKNECLRLLQKRLSQADLKLALEVLAGRRQPDVQRFDMFICTHCSGRLISFPAEGFSACKACGIQIPLPDATAALVFSQACTPVNSAKAAFVLQEEKPQRPKSVVVNVHRPKNVKLEPSSRRLQQFKLFLSSFSVVDLQALVPIVRAVQAHLAPAVEADEAAVVPCFELVAEVLETLNKKKFYPVVCHITSQLPGGPPPLAPLAPEAADKLGAMFREVGGAFSAGIMCIVDRNKRQGAPYAFLAWHFFRILQAKGEDIPRSSEYLRLCSICMRPALRDSLETANRLMEKMCQSLSWPFVAFSTAQVYK